MQTAATRRRPSPAQTYNNPQPLYFVETLGTTRSTYGHRWFVELDRDRNSRDFVIGLIASGEVEAVKVLEVDEVEGTCRDVTLEMQMEASGLVEAA